MSRFNRTLTVTARGAGGYTIENRDIRLAADTVSIRLAGTGPAPLAFRAGPRAAGEAGGIAGTVAADLSAGPGVKIRREIFTSSDGRVAAVRFAVRNTGRTRIRLESISPLEITCPESLTVAGGGLSAWKVLRYPFHKSDIPSYFRPSVADKDFEDAVFSCINAVPGQGVVYNTLNTAARTVTAGPVMIIRNAEKAGAPALMLCALGVKRHFFEMALTMTGDRRRLESLVVSCNFDRIALDPGDETGTDWLMFTTDPREADLLALFAEAAARNYNPPLPRPHKPSPTVYCTWYFYTFNINERYVAEELAAIRELAVPLDVFQIDDGWMDGYGTYEAHPNKFPGGMARVAAMIRAAGMTPGIWACPFVINSASPILKRFPDIALLDDEGRPLIYDTSTNDCYVLDPTAPGARAYLEETFRKLKGWGFRYFKLDWLRAMYEFAEARFRDPKTNRAGAYAAALRIIRETLGDDCYLLACGGLSDHGNQDLVNGQRTSKDVRGRWDGPEGIPKSGALVQVKQNLLRNYTNRFYDADPDATQIRLRDKPFFPGERKCVGVCQSEGHYTDEEAFTICAHQYLTGGLVTISERFPELQAARLALLRHISPAVTPPAEILDYDTPVCPTLFLTPVTPCCAALGRWWTLAAANWEDEPVTRTLRPADLASANGRLAVFDFRAQAFLGLRGPGEPLTVTLPAHGIRVFRLTPWDGRAPKILGTDLHLSGGGCEITACAPGPDRVVGRVETRWRYPVTVTAGFPTAGGGVAVAGAHVPAGRHKFTIRPPRVPGRPGSGRTR